MVAEWPALGVAALHKPADVNLHHIQRERGGSGGVPFAEMALPWAEAAGVGKVRTLTSLDREVSGPVLVALTAAVSKEAAERPPVVRARFLALVAGRPAEHFSCDSTLSEPGPAGGGRKNRVHLDAHTDFRVLCRFDSGRSMIKHTYE